MRSIILQDNKLVKTVAITTAFSLLLWTVGLQSARGASVDDFSDTLTDTGLSAGADHTIVFTLTNAVPADGSTMTLTFESGFDLAVNGVGEGDIDIAGDTTGEMTTAVDCEQAGDEEVGVSVSGQEITFEICNGDGGNLLAGEVVTIEIGENADGGSNQIVNPGTEGSYTIDLGGTMSDSGQTRVYIIDDIQMTAQVNTTFTFSISGVASGQSGANGEVTTTTVATEDAGTDPEVDWGTLTAGSAEVARHDLAVTTNAQGGFAVTVWQDGNIRSANGSDIDQFVDGTPPGTPYPTWSAPTTDVGDENTWGHMGITSADDSLSGGSPFQDNGVGYAAIPTGTGSPLEVFYHDGPVDDSGSPTAGESNTEIGYKLEISALQEAADDYSNLVTYVATPVF